MENYYSLTPDLLEVIATIGAQELVIGLKGGNVELDAKSIGKDEEFLLVAFS